jgi:hypothetical protein
LGFKKASGKEFEIWHVTDKGKAKFGKEISALWMKDPKRDVLFSLKK